MDIAPCEFGECTLDIVVILLLDIDIVGRVKLQFVARHQTVGDDVDSGACYSPHQDS